MKNIVQKGEVQVIIAGIFWGMIGIFTRNLSVYGLTSIQITFLRNLMAAIILFIYIYLKDKESLKIAPKDIWIFIGTGVLSIAFFNVCYFKTIEMTSLSVAAVLLYTAPAFVLVMSSIFFKEAFYLKKLFALILAFFGCFLTTGILGSNPNISSMGLIIGLGSGFGYALYSIFGTVASRKYNSYTISLYTFILATISLLPLCQISDLYMLSIKHIQILPLSIGLAVISTIIPFLCYTLGLQKMEAGRAAILAFSEPLFASIVGVVVFNEALTLTNILGILMIFLSIALVNHKTTQAA